MVLHAATVRRVAVLCQMSTTVGNVDHIRDRRQTGVGTNVGPVGPLPVGAAPIEKISIFDPHLELPTLSNAVSPIWPIPTRTTVLNRCTAAIHSAGYEPSANQQLCGLQVVLAAIGQN